uniref:Poly A polymerase n=1 Tax=Myoviridae sp. ctYA416 TaxID=2825125 RepID=A0A8S5UTA7_9CAUD|nr:MAG TPA: Poly A polymerase [Myoviridae sp. ctYA416]
MAISVFKDQERTIRLSQDKDLFEKYFKPLVGLPQSDNHHGMDAMQHTVAVVRSVENVLTELEKTQDIKFNDEEIMALHIAALFHDTA